MFVIFFPILEDFSELFFKKVPIFQKQADREGNFIMCCLACCLDFILGYLEQLLQYLVRNAYIVVARDGTPLYQSGKRAFHLLSRNLTDVIALNTFGDIVLVVARLLIVLIAGFVGYIAMVSKVLLSF